MRMAYANARAAVERVARHLELLLSRLIAQLFHQAYVFITGRQRSPPHRHRGGQSCSSEGRLQRRDDSLQFAHRRRASSAAGRSLRRTQHDRFPADSVPGPTGIVETSRDEQPHHPVVTVLQQRLMAPCRTPARPSVIVALMTGRHAITSSLNPDQTDRCVLDEGVKEPRHWIHHPHRPSTHPANGRKRPDIAA